MVYVLRDGDNAIVGFGETPFVAGPGQTVEAVETALAEYAARFRLAADRRVIAADGLDTATVTLRVGITPPPVSVSLLVNGTPVSVPLTGGVGALEIAAETPGEVVIEPADPAVYCRAGEGSLVVVAGSG